MLREMGIQVWIPKESEDRAVPAVQSQKVSQNEVSTSEPLLTSAPTIPQNPVITSKVDPQQDQADQVLAPSLEMKWTLLVDQNDAHQGKLFAQVIRAIEDLGVTCQTLEANASFEASHIEGQVLIALGQKMGQLVSGDRDAVEHLRGILFDAQNKAGEEIPALVTYSMSDLVRTPKNKSSFWDDLLWARSVWIDSRLY